MMTQVQDAIAVQSDEQAIAQMEFEQYIEEQANAVIKEGIEIDAIWDGCSTLYRVWREMKLLGTFYLDTVENLWVSQSRFPTEGRHHKSTLAVIEIINVTDPIA